MTILDSDVEQEDKDDLFASIKKAQDFFGSNNIDENTVLAGGSKG